MSDNSALPFVAMTCARCDAECSRQTKAKRFCPKCIKERRREQRVVYKRLRRERDKATRSQIKPIVPCQRCSKPIRKRNPQHRHCTECRVEGDRRTALERTQRWRSTPEAKARAAAIARERRARDPKAAIRARVSAAIYDALRKNKAGRSWEKIVGYSLADLVAHLERQFVRGMSWENHGKWHIDHIRPIASFSFTSDADADFKDCWALTNLRPLWARKNREKNDKRQLLI